MRLSVLSACKLKKVLYSACSAGSTLAAADGTAEPVGGTGLETRLLYCFSGQIAPPCASAWGDAKSASAHAIADSAIISRSDWIFIYASLVSEMLRQR